MKVLEPDMVPLPFNYYRSHPLTSKGWKEIRKTQLARTGGLCEFCGNPGKIIHHEYSYTIIKDPSMSICSISRFVTEFVVSCYRCNEVLHFVWASNTARSERAIEWLMQVRKITQEEARKLVLEKVNLWVSRSQMTPIYGEADRYKLRSDNVYVDTFTGQEVR